MNRLIALDKFEIDAEASLRAHKAFSETGPEREDLLDVLIQRRHFSMEFTRVYDFLLESVDDERAKRVIRQIIREEYPTDRKSHREDLVDDICKVGASRLEVIGTPPTAHTRSCLAELDSYLYEIVRSCDASVAAIAFLRSWGELLTAVEYGTFWDRWLNRYLAIDEGSNLPKSEFYWFHFSHDQKATLWCDLRDAGDKAMQTHADVLGICLLDELDRDGVADLVMNVQERAAAMKVKFYDQFA